MQLVVDVLKDKKAELGITVFVTFLLMLLASAFMYFAEHESQLVGFLEIREASNPNLPMFKARRFAKVDSAVVDEAMRGSGIGTRLFEGAVTWARERGLNSIETAVWNCNTEAHKFYLDQGFQPVVQKLELEIRADGDMP